MIFFNFRPKLFQRQFHLILTILVIKTQNMSENGEIYTAGREKKFEKKRKWNGDVDNLPTGRI